MSSNFVMLVLKTNIRTDYCYSALHKPLSAVLCTKEGEAR